MGLMTWVQFPPGREISLSHDIQTGFGAHLASIQWARVLFLLEYNGSGVTLASPFYCLGQEWLSLNSILPYVFMTCIIDLTQGQLNLTM